MKDNNAKAAAEVTRLKGKSKKEVFAIYAQACLGRVFSEDLSMRKSWMIYDIIKATYGAAIADAVC